MKETVKPTLKQIFHTEQVVQNGCDTVTNYRREIEYTIGVLEGHLVRVERWQRGDLARVERWQREEQFNSEFMQLMQELEAKEHDVD